MNVQKPNHAPEPGYPSRRQFAESAKLLGIAAIGLGSITTTGCIAGKQRVEPLSDISNVRTAGAIAVEERPVVAPVPPSSLIETTTTGGLPAFEPSPEPQQKMVSKDVALGGKMAMEPKPAPAFAPSAARTYVVRKGDTLSGIAKKMLGSGDRWPEIAKANPKIKPDSLKVGQSITVPAAGKKKEAPRLKGVLRTSPHHE